MRTGRGADLEVRDADLKVRDADLNVRATRSGARRPHIRRLWSNRVRARCADRIIGISPHDMRRRIRPRRHADPASRTLGGLGAEMRT